MEELSLKESLQIYETVKFSDNQYKTRDLIVDGSSYHNETCAIINNDHWWNAYEWMLPSFIVKFGDQQFKPHESSYSRFKDLFK